MNPLCLTRPQVQAIAGLARGHHLPAIAAYLNLTRNTVRDRLAYAAHRLDIHGGTHPQLVHYAYLHGYLDKLDPEPREPLTALPLREAQSLNALTRGLSVAQTASELGIAPNTADVQRRSLYRRLEAFTAAHAVALGWQHGLMTRETT